MSENSDQNWTPCEGGEIASLADRLKHLRRRDIVRKALTGSVCVLALITAGTLYFNRESDLPPLSHQAAVRLLPAYQAGQLDADTTAQMKAHLAHCEACRRALEKLKDEESLFERDVPDGAVGQISVTNDSMLASAQAR